MVSIHTRKELEQYLDDIYWDGTKETGLSSTYFLASYHGKTEPVYFYEYEGKWLESPCTAVGIPCTKEKLESYVREAFHDKYFDVSLDYLRTTYRDGWLYQIEIYEVEPYLPEELVIEKVLTKSECLDWILEHEETAYKKEG